MKVKDVLAFLEKEVAPLSLSDEFCSKYKLYDNSGIIIDCGGEVSGILFALDLSPASADMAVKLGYNLIVTHHPAIYGGITHIDATGDPQSKAIKTCLVNGVSVISMHLNFDAAPEGIDYYLMCGLGGKKAELSAELCGGGYGRVYEIAPVICADYLKKVKREFSSERIFMYGGGNKQIRKVASFCGAGCDEHNIAFACEKGADLFVSTDLKHHEICALVGRGLNVFQLTHYASENYGLNKIYLKIKDRLGAPSQYFTDESYL